MNPVRFPASPAMASVAPLNEMPARRLASPSTTIRPPWAEAAALCETLPLTRITPDIRFSPMPQPVNPFTVMSGPSPSPPM